MFIIIIALLAGLSSAVTTSTQNGFTVQMDDESNGQLPASTVQNQVTLFFQLYPQTQSNYVGAPTTVNITLDPNMPSNSAGVSLGGMSLSVARLQGNANDSAYMQFVINAMLGGLATKAPTTNVQTTVQTTITTTKTSTIAPTTKAVTNSSGNTYVRNGLTLIVQDNSGGALSSSIIQSEIDAFFNLYPQATSIRGGTPTTLTLIFDPNTAYAAASSNSLVVGSNWLLQNPSNTGALGAAINQSVSGFPYQKNGITVNIQDLNSGMTTAAIQNLVNTFFTVYPEEVAYYKPKQSFTNLTFILDPNGGGISAVTEVTYVNGIASMGGANIRFNSTYVKSEPNDLDLVTHESMHVTQFGGALWCKLITGFSQINK